MSLSDNNNSVTSERVTLLPDTIVSLRRLNEYPWKHGETHPINITEDMVSDVKEAWKINAQWQRKEENTRKCSEEK